MGIILRLLFWALAIFWVYRQIIRPLFSGISGESPRSSFQSKKTKTPAAKEPKIEYRKFRDDDGEYIDYEEIK